jgi:hypothetical protein
MTELGFRDGNELFRCRSILKLFLDVQLQFPEPEKPKSQWRRLHLVAKELLNPLYPGKLTAGCNWRCAETLLSPNGVHGAGGR